MAEGDGEILRGPGGQRFYKDFDQAEREARELLAVKAVKRRFEEGRRRLLRDRFRLKDDNGQEIKPTEDELKALHLTGADIPSSEFVKTLDSLKLDLPIKEAFVQKYCDRYNSRAALTGSHPKYAFEEALNPNYVIKQLKENRPTKISSRAVRQVSKAA